MSKPRNMGMPNLSEVTFVRKFRWTVTIDGLPNISEQFFKSVEFSGNKIQGQIYEIAFFDGNKWMENPVIGWLMNPSSSLTFTTYDGCGYPIYKTKYSGLKLVSLNPQTFDYSNSDTSNIEFVLSFDNAEHEFLYNNPKESTEEPLNSVEKASRILAQATANRPKYLPKSAEAEETKVDTCCGTSHVPGRTCCKDRKKIGPFKTANVKDEPPAPIQELGDALGKMRFGDVQALQKYLKEKYELNARFF